MGSGETAAPSGILSSWCSCAMAVRTRHKPAIDHRPDLPPIVDNSSSDRSDHGGVADRQSRRHFIDEIL